MKVEKLQELEIEKRLREMAYTASSIRPGQIDFFNAFLGNTDYTINWGKLEFIFDGEKLLLYNVRLKRVHLERVTTDIHARGYLWIYGLYKPKSPNISRTPKEYSPEEDQKDSSQKMSSTNTPIIRSNRDLRLVAGRDPYEHLREKNR